MKFNLYFKCQFKVSTFNVGTSNTLTNKMLVPAQALLGMILQLNELLSDEPCNIFVIHENSCESLINVHCVDTYSSSSISVFNNTNTTLSYNEVWSRLRAHQLQFITLTKAYEDMLWNPANPDYEKDMLIIRGTPVLKFFSHVKHYLVNVYSFLSFPNF